MPFEDDEVLFLTTEVENSLRCLQEAPNAQVPQLGPEAYWQSGIVGIGLRKAGTQAANLGCAGGHWRRAMHWSNSTRREPVPMLRAVWLPASGGSTESDCQDCGWARPEMHWQIRVRSCA